MDSSCITSLAMKKGIIFCFDWLSLLCAIQTKEKSNASVNVFPNPGSGFFSIELESTGETTIKIYDAIGSNILTKTANSLSFSIDLTDFANGIYIIEIVQGGNVSKRKVMKI